MSDPSLAAALLKATPEMLLNDLNTLGFLFEALCERDMKIYAESFDAELYHYQDYNNNEMDAVISMPNGEWCGFEIKLGANQIDAAAQNLTRIRNEIRKDGGKEPATLCVVCGLSNAIYAPGWSLCSANHSIEKLICYRKAGNTIEFELHTTVTTSK